MLSIAIAAFLRPFAFVALMAVIVIPLELLLRRIWPEGRVKRILFGRNFDKRHPKAWTAICRSGALRGWLLDFPLFLTL